MRIKLAFAAITLAALAVACQPEESATVAGFPICEGLPTSFTCVEVWESIDGTGHGVIFHPSGDAQLINFWSDGSFELH